MNKRWINLNGDLIDAGQPALSPENRGLWYGDGCFDTLRSYSGKFLHLDDHIQRLRDALEYLELRVPDLLEKNELRNQLHELLSKNRLEKEDSLVRIQFWREGGRGYKMPDDGHFGYLITADPISIKKEPVKLITSSIRRIPSASLNPRFKLSNGINYIKASAEAQKKDADDALMLTIQDYISETTISNLFWFSDETVYTPSSECDILPGITREIVVELVEEELDLPLIEGQFQREDLERAETVWICNSVRELLPVKTIDGMHFSTTHAFFEELTSAFESYKEEHLA